MKRRIFKIHLTLWLLAISCIANATPLVHDYGCQGDIIIHVNEEKTVSHSLPYYGYVNPSSGWFLRERYESSYSDKREAGGAKIMESDSQSCTIRGMWDNSDWGNDGMIHKLQLYCVATRQSTNEEYQCYWNVTVINIGDVTVSASPSGGTVKKGTKVYLTASISGSEIHYNTYEGVTPSEYSTLYTSSGITIDQETTLNAIAFKTGYNSVPSTWKYTVYEDSIEISATNFPDDNFRNYLLSQSYGEDGKLTESEISEIHTLGISEKNISSLKGIEIFTSLTRLYCGKNQLTTLDVSKNTKLEVLDCSGNQLCSLDVSKNTVLESLNCSNNQLTTLDMSKNTALFDLDCYNNQLTNLDVSKNTALIYLYCYNNQLTILDVTKNTTLKNLECYDNQLTALDVSKNTVLVKLWCYNNQLITLKVSKNTTLKKLYCENNKLTNLDVSNNSALTSLSCDDNQLTTLNVSGCTSLTMLACNRNQIKDEGMDALVECLPIVSNGRMNVIDVINEGNIMTTEQVAAAKAKGWEPLYYNNGNWLMYEGSAVVGISIDETNFPDESFRNWVHSQNYGTDGVLTEGEINEIHTLSIEDKNIYNLKGVELFTSLESLFCNNNQLTSLDVSQNTTLIHLECQHNQLTSLNVSKNTALIYLYCYNNQLTILDVSKNTALGSLSCLENQLTNLDVSKNLALTFLNCGNNQLADLDVSKNIALKSLYCYGNQLTTLNMSGCTALTLLTCYNNTIKGTAMDVLVNSLPVNTTGEEHRFYSINPTSEEEGNVGTKNQMAIVKERGWFPCYYDSETKTYIEYEGSDEESALQGDVNHDGYVNGTDLVTLVNIILDKQEETSAADVNRDGYVNGTDIVALVNIILGRASAPQKVKALAQSNGEASLSIEDFDINAGETKDMIIDLNNPNDELTLVQFDLHLPEGVSIKETDGELDFDMCGRTTWRKHSLDVNIIDGYYRFLLYSSSNTIISGTEGGLLKVTLSADDNFIGGTIRLDNILLVTPDQKETQPDALEYNIGVIVPPMPEDTPLTIAEDFYISGGETKEMVIELSNPDDEITLVQFDLHLPEGLSIKETGGELDFDMCDRTTWRKHTLDVNMIDGYYRFLLYSSNNTIISGTEGGIIKVMVTADNEFDEGIIHFDNILLVGPDQTEIKPSTYDYEVAIQDIQAKMNYGKSSVIFNLSGQRLTKPQRGVNIINGRKVVIK